MHAHNDRDQFAPPRPPGRLRAISLAVLAHVVLLGALTWGVKWKTSADQPAVEAELWSAVPQQAAPREVAPPPPPAPEPEPPGRHRLRPAAASAPRQVEPDTREADIAIEREKKRLEQEKKLRQQQIEREKRERERKEEERRERLEQEKKERLEQEKKERLQKEKAEREKEQREKLAEQKKTEQEKQKKLAEDKRKAEAEAKRLEEQRQANLRRMQGLAGATGGETATGTAQRSSGPSGSYGGKVAAKVRPNIVYPDAISGNPRAVVEVRAAPDGTIVGRRLIQSSGNKAWDEAVLRALDKTETLPRDVDGRVPSSLEIGFRPQD
ncbi:cell envelope integrity protein TolA [Paenacidovorax monticola]|uniref:Cell envelope integrity protein TolA n=1 Tax=Paenacidovorax monticola TaxID=1926868 RepID=A0A7H0HJR8_9BURK|nr:cell envelope integrity protein TolA [Paenacidovorax monticola]QNP60784.1 cell envelope integrity protein TolA [Paenacidovorax monticola]